MHKNERTNQKTHTERARECGDKILHHSKIPDNIEKKTHTQKRNFVTLVSLFGLMWIFLVAKSLAKSHHSQWAHRTFVRSCAIHFLFAFKMINVYFFFFCVFLMTTNIAPREAMNFEFDLKNMNSVFIIQPQCSLCYIALCRTQWNNFCFFHIVFFPVKRHQYFRVSVCDGVSVYVTVCTSMWNVAIHSASTTGYVDIYMNLYERWQNRRRRRAYAKSDYGSMRRRQLWL